MQGIAGSKRPRGGVGPRTGGGSRQRALALFPGMAAAAPGMGLRLAGTAVAVGVFAEFSAACGVDVSHLACAADDGELHGDRSWELAVVATEVAAVIVLRQILLAGREESVHELAARVGSGALGVNVLPVRWLLHTSLMRPASRELVRRRAEVGELRPFRVPVYSALHSGCVEGPLEGWRLLVEHHFRPDRFDRAFEAATGDGLVRCVELGPAGTLERAVRWLGRPGVEVETFPGGAPDRVRERKARC